MTEKIIIIFIRNLQKIWRFLFFIVIFVYVKNCIWERLIIIWIRCLLRSRLKNVRNFCDGGIKMEIENQIIYLALRPKHLMCELSINQWNDFITSYENDNNAVVEEYDEKYDGYFFVTTNLHNILKNHSILDLRFNVGYRTEQHKTDYSL